MRFSFLFFIIIFLMISCSHGGSPVEPSPDLTQNSTRNPSISGEHMCWGTWDVYIDPFTSNVEIVPIRGASFECNVVNFLQPPTAPIHLLTISINPGGTNFPEGLISCDVVIQHPFPGTKFCGFDVMGIVMGDYDPINLASDPDIITSIPPQALLQNPDGYTRWWNQSEFTTYGTLLGYIEGAKSNPTWNSSHTLNAFKYFSDDIDTEDPFDPSHEQRGFFSSENPGINSRRYTLRFPVDGAPIFHFKYAISASWIAPLDGTTAPWEPEDWAIDANMPEAFKIDFIDDGSTAYFENESTYGGDLVFQIELRDWQFDGALSNVMNEFATITLESPTLFPTPIDLDLTAALVSMTDPTLISVPAVIENVTPSDVENQYLVITAKSANPATYEPQIPGISGFEFPTGDLAAYNIIEVPIIPEAPVKIPPIADASASSPTAGAAPLTVDFDPSLSYDPDGVIVLYEWDFDSDGTYDTSTVAPEIVPHVYGAGVHIVTLQVTDDDGLTDTDEIHISVIGDDSGWPMYRRHFKRTGLTSVIGPSTPNIRFIWEVPDGVITKGIRGGIAIDHQQRAVFRTDAGYLYCVTLEGVMAWKYYVGGTHCWSCASVDSDGCVYVGNESGEFFKIDSDGNLVWSNNYGYGAINGGIAVQDDGTAIFGSEGGRCVKIDSDGIELWAFNSGWMYGGCSIGENGIIYISTQAGFVYALDQDGNEIWGSDISSSTINAVPALGEFGMYLGDWSQTFRCVDYDGHVVWETPLSGMQNAAALDNNGNVYVGTYDDSLYCLDQLTGGINWSFPTSGTIMTTAACIDGEGKIYVGNDAGDFYCLTPDGDLVWSYSTGTGLIQTKSPAIADDGTVVVGTLGGFLYGFQDE